MIKFLKKIFKMINFKSDNEELNKYNKIVYGLIVLCAIIFFGIIVYFVVTNWPQFVQTIQTEWENKNTILKR